MSFKFILDHVATAAAGATGKETVCGGVVAAIATFATVYLGGWDVSLRLLTYLMIADLITGFLGAIKTKSVNSEPMFWGGIRKAIILLIVFLAVQFDQFAVGNAPVFRTIAIYFYAGREGLSVAENLGKLGMPLPEQFTKFLQQLKGNADGIEISKRKDVY